MAFDRIREAFLEAGEQPGVRQLGWPLFLTTLGTLILELTFSRLFSAVLFYHYAFMAISMALLGLSIGALVARLLPRQAGASRFGRVLSGACLLGAISLIPVLDTVLNTSIWLVTTWHAFWELAKVFLACMVPFTFAGFVAASAIAKGSRQAASLYFFDLLGASAGCLLFVPVIGWLGAPNTVLVVAMIWVTAALSWLVNTHSRLFAGLNYIFLTLLAAVLLVNHDGKIFDVRISHGAPRTNEIFSSWNAFSRVSVQQRPNNILWIEIDGGAGTWIPGVDFDGPSGKAFAAWLGKTGPDQAFLMSHQPRVLVIGAGGGVDVARAIAAGSKVVTAVEINPIIAKTVAKRFQRQNYSLFERPEVHLFIEDGRTFAQQTKSTFDVIQLSQVDTWAASASGAYALTENYLYTVDAIRAYYNRLSEEGRISISRWEFRRPRETVRLASVMAQALVDEHVANPEQHLVVILEDLPEYPEGNVRMGTVLLQRAPFNADQLRTLETRLEGTRMRLAYAPGIANDFPFNQLLSGTDREQFLGSYEFDVSPVTDDRPFFFFMGRWRKAFSQAFAFDASGDTVNTGAQFLLLAVFALTFLAVIALFLVPTWLAGRQRLTLASTPFLTFATMVGLGYITVEIVLIQRFVVLLGQPVYSLTVVVFTLLFGSSLGSRFSARILDRDLAKRSRQSLALIVATILSYSALLARFTVHLQAAPTLLKVLAVVGVTFPLGLLMGMPFAIALRMASRAAPRLLEWCWAMNAAATVLGAVTSILLAVIFGLTLTLLVGAGCYAGGFLLLRLMQTTKTAIRREVRELESEFASQEL